jgi:hypothetical protein
MTCQKAGDLLSAYIEGELAVRQSGALETHLTGCDGCREKLETLRNVVAMLEAPRALAKPEGLLEEFKEKYLPTIEAEPAPRWGFRLPALPQFEWPSMGRVLLPMGGMAAAAAALMVALHTQQAPNPVIPDAPAGSAQIAATAGASEGSRLADLARAEKAAATPGLTSRAALSEPSGTAGRRDKATGAPSAAPRNETVWPAEKSPTTAPRAGRRPPVYIARTGSTDLELRMRRPSRSIRLKAGGQYAAAPTALSSVDENEMAVIGSAHKEAKPTLEDQWKSVAAVTLRRSASKAVSVEEGYAEVSCRNVKTGDVNRAAFGAPVAATVPAAPAVSTPAETAEPAAPGEPE